MPPEAISSSPVSHAESLLARNVAMVAMSFGRADWVTHRFHIALTKDRIQKSPTTDLAEPVSRQHEVELSRYYGYPFYWGGASPWGMGAFPGLLATQTWSEPVGEHAPTPGDAHLWSINEICGYHVEGSDGAIGHVDDFIVDDETWQVQYLVVDTSIWWFGKHVLVAPRWASRVSWPDRKVHVGLTRSSIKSSPVWNPEATVNREYEERLYDYYGRPAYWAGGEPWDKEPVRRGEVPRPA